METTDPAALEAETCKTCHYGQEEHRAFCPWPDANDEEPCGNWRPIEVSKDGAKVASLKAELAAERAKSEALAVALELAGEDLNWMCNNRKYLSWHVLVERAVKVCFALETYREGAPK